MISTVERLQLVIADSDDDRLLEYAAAGRADYNVMGDDHLLDIRSNGVRILTVR